HAGIVDRVDHDRDATCLRAVVLGGRAQHGRATDVDVLDGVLEGAVRARRRLPEWVQVDDQQVDATDAVLFDGLEMLGHVATCQQAPVYLGVQGLDAAVEDFGGAGVVGHFLNLQAAFGQQLGSAARGQQ